LGDQFFVRDLADAGAKVKQVMAEAFTSNLSQDVVKQMLTEAVSRLSEGKINALLNTAIRTTERTAYAELIGDLPDDTVMVYAGPADDRNRPFCREWVDRELTLGEVSELMNDEGQPSLTAAGGYNCRHEWVMK